MNNSSIENLNKLSELVEKRILLESRCTNPDEWRALADEFGEIGAYVNQDKCLRLAAHYEKL